MWRPIILEIRNIGGLKDAFTNNAGGERTWAQIVATQAVSPQQAPNLKERTNPKNPQKRRFTGNHNNAPDAPATKHHHHFMSEYFWTYSIGRIYSRITFEPTVPHSAVASRTFTFSHPQNSGRTPGLTLNKS